MRNPKGWTRTLDIPLEGPNGQTVTPPPRRRTAFWVFTGVLLLVVGVGVVLGWSTDTRAAVVRALVGGSL